VPQALALPDSSAEQLMRMKGLPLHVALVDAFQVMDVDALALAAKSDPVV
jgi:hypothetical protein